MLAPNDARITGLRCVEATSGSSAGVVAAGSPVEVVVTVEAGAALFGVGARFSAGVQLEGVAPGVVPRIAGWLGGDRWPSPVVELRFPVAGAATAGLADRLLGVAATLRVNAAPPFLASAQRGTDLHVVPAAPNNSLTNGP